jgi:hypothetical protein
MTTGRDTSSKADAVTIAAIEAGVPRLIEAREIIAKFHSMIRQKAAADLAPWIAQRAKASSPRSAMALKKTRQRCVPQLFCHGLTGKPRVKSHDSSS